MNLTDKLLKESPVKKRSKSFLDSLTKKQLNELFEFRDKYNNGTFDDYPLGQIGKHIKSYFGLSVNFKTVGVCLRESKDVSR